MERPGVVFMASHLGYPMDRTPLGGGAMVGLQLARHWAAEAKVRLALLGSGPESPVANGPDVVYERVAARPDGLVNLSELAYARFCRDFERQTTQWLLSRRARWPSESTAVVVNDISEGPDLSALKQAGYPIVSIWHVDVVDYFNKIYLKGLVRPQTVTTFYERLRRLHLSRAVPDVLRLVFEKQRETVEHSDLMVLPSSAMEQTIALCYSRVIRGRHCTTPAFKIQPWGSLDTVSTPDARRLDALRKHYQIGAETVSILTLSRISPEKGIHHLLDSLLVLERRKSLPRDVALFICGEPAFMQGRVYNERLRRLAAKFRKVRCFFPGYLSSAEKPYYFSMADLFVSPSVHESYGLTIVEAMRAGLPVLANHHHGVKDILDDASGVRVPNVKLGEVLAVLLNDRSKLKTMGAAAAKRAAGMRFDAAASSVLEAAIGLLKAPAEVS